MKETENRSGESPKIFASGVDCYCRRMMTSPRSPHARRQLRLIAAAIFGCGVGLLVGLLADPVYGLAAGWVGAASVYVTWVWLVIGRMDPEQTRQHATTEDPGRTLGEMLVLAASVASLGAVALLLVRAHRLQGLTQDAVAALALITVALSWAVIHTRYALRYARVYYSDPVGGIDFHGKVEDARYVDFAYVAFDLGQTFQISDTDLETSQLRGIVLRHTLLSYVFSTVVLATVINLVASLG